jgi:hypothetical protein
MGKVYDGIDDRLRSFLEAQHVFFVATAPLAGEGHVNVSPKGLASFRILGPREVAYLDLVGSGIETVSHLRENGRIVLMFCAFEGPPKIVRLHGRARAVEPGDADWAKLASGFPSYPSVRAIVVAELDRISDSCGYGVPLMRYEGERPQLHAWAEKRGADGLRSYQLENNLASIDGLPGLRAEGLAPE